jgi:azurin
MNRTIVFVLLGAAMASIGCQNADPAEGKRAPTAVSATPAPAPTPDPAPAETQQPAPQVVELELGTVGDTMAFDKTKLSVPSGSKVHLVLTNHGTVAVMTHNWVLVRKGAEAHVAADGLEKAATTGYVVPGDDVLAYTPMAPPGKTAEVIFDAPAPGTYPFICTFPGHYMVMKGELTVTP